MDEKLIKEFFDSMKQADEKLTIPVYESKKKKSRWIQISTVAAAIITCVVVGFALLKNNDDSSSVEIVVLQIDQTGTSSLMTTENTLDKWESPTGSLIDDF